MSEVSGSRRLRQFARAIAALEDERAELGAQLRDTRGAAAEAGFDRRALAEALRRRKFKAAHPDTEELVELYLAELEG